MYYPTLLKELIVEEYKEDNIETFPVNLYTTGKDKLTLKVSFQKEFELFNKNNLDVEIHKNKVVINYNRNSKDLEKNRNKYFIKEIYSYQNSSVQYSREINLPFEIIPEKTTTAIENNILTIQMQSPEDKTKLPFKPKF